MQCSAQEASTSPSVKDALNTPCLFCTLSPSIPSSLCLSLGLPAWVRELAQIFGLTQHRHLYEASPQVVETRRGCNQ